MKRNGMPGTLMMLLALYLLTGCFFTDTPQGQKIAEKVAGGLNDFLEDVDEKYGDDINQAFEDLKNAEHKGGPFENNLESAREYLLGQLREKLRELKIIHSDLEGRIKMSKQRCLYIGAAP